MHLVLAGQITGANTVRLRLLTEAKMTTETKF